MNNAINLKQKTKTQNLAEKDQSKTNLKFYEDNKLLITGNR